MLAFDHNYKPLDFGNGLTTGSVNDQGRFVALNTAHPQQGYVTLTCMPPFPEDRRYDPTYVRRYRATLADSALTGFGCTFHNVAHHPSTCMLEANALPRVRLALAKGITADLLTFAPDRDDTPVAGALQICTITNESDQPYACAYTWGGTLTLTRASYAQLTEGGPLPRPADHVTITHTGNCLTVANTGLGWAVAVLGVPSGQAVYHQEAAPLDLHLASTLQVDAHAQTQFIVAYGFGANAAEAQVQAQALAQCDADALLDQTLARRQALTTLVTASTNPPEAAWLANRALAYILDCCAVPVGKTTCLITDHQLLPLAWTRDAYYAVQAILALRHHAARAGTAGTLIVAQSDDLIRRHLYWLFEVAERRDGYWGRAYLTNGTCKDQAFQFDQQCYPLLEIVDYVDATGDMTMVQKLQSYLAATLDMLLECRAPDAWLFPTSETPADDAVAMPYHFSSQVLAWRTFTALAKLNTRSTFTSHDLAAMAERIRHDIYQHMVVTHAGTRLFAYLVDLQGGYRLYHDANDLPTVLAPQWGFCAADDPVWRATLAFAFSPENSDGFYPGQFGGLGSVHTPHPWPLGDVQELLVARMLADQPRQEAVWHKIRALACWDGSLPEAYDEATGAVASRHWFAWPGAALAMVALMASPVKEVPTQ